MLPSRTFISHDENNPAGYKQSKERVTLMVCANGNGSHKIPLFLIGKSKVPVCFKNVDMTKLPVKYANSKNA